MKRVKEYYKDDFDLIVDDFDETIQDCNRNSASSVSICFDMAYSILDFLFILRENFKDVEKNIDENFWREVEERKKKKK